MALGELKNGIGPDAYAIYQQVLAAVVERDHPVGSLYISSDPTSPASLFGGTWEQIKDRFILAAGDTYAAGSTGGEAKHTLTTSEMPNHEHKIRYGGDEANNGAISSALYKLVSINSGEWFATRSFLMSTGGSGAHNNMPPYITMYAWKRIA